MLLCALQAALFWWAPPHLYHLSRERTAGPDKWIGQASGRHLRLMSSPDLFTVDCCFPMVLVGLNAILSTMCSPLEMPPALHGIPLVGRACPPPSIQWRCDMRRQPRPPLGTQATWDDRFAGQIARLESLAMQEVLQSDAFGSRGGGGGRAGGWGGGGSPWTPPERLVLVRTCPFRISKWSLCALPSMALPLKPLPISKPWTQNTAARQACLDRNSSHRCRRSLGAW